MTENGKNFGADELTPFREWTTLTTDNGPEVRVRLYGPMVRLESHLVPARLEIKTGGEGEPEIYARVEVDENGSKLAELRFVSTDPDARGIRQSDLREIRVTALLEDFVAMFTLGHGLFPYLYMGTDAPAESIETYGLELYSAGETDNGVEPSFLRVARGLRRGRKRDITPALLEKVAEIYRANIHGAPTRAVEHHFQVSQRMGVEYVSRARKAGLLPATVKGRKQA
jgi:hypothetical protein